MLYKCCYIYSLIVLSFRLNLEAVLPIPLALGEGYSYYSPFFVTHVSIVSWDILIN